MRHDANTTQAVISNNPEILLSTSETLAKGHWGSIFDHSEALKAVAELFSECGENTAQDLKDFLFKITHYVYDSPAVKIHGGEMNGYLQENLQRLYSLLDAIDKTRISE